MWVEILLTILVVYYLWQSVRKPSNIPPGEWGYPILGHIPIGMKSIDKKLLDLQRKHGDIVTWKIGSKVAVFLFNFKDIKEAFQGVNFINRPDMQSFSLLRGERVQGLVATNGIHWQNIRRFSLRHLRDLGMGKSNFVTAIQFEATELVNEMKKQAGKPAPVPKYLLISVLNVIWQLVASKRYDLHDEQIKEFDHLILDIQQNLGAISLTDFFPWLAKVLPGFLTNWLIKADKCEDLSNKLRAFVQGHIDEHKRTLDPDNPKDFIDEYLIELGKPASDSNSMMSNEDLIYCITDLFGAGSETTSTTLHFAILYLASHTEIQKKLQREIDEVLPKGSSVTLEDRQRLPYTEAFIHEVLRFSTLAPIGGIHEAITDTKLRGYLIPKGTIVLSGISNVHFNTKFFSSPNEFNPERFLNSEGKFVLQKEGFMPFGIGRRQCLGESLARMELLVFLTTLVQNLDFAAPPGVKIDFSADSRNPFFHMPKEESVIISVRS